MRTRIGSRLYLAQNKDSPVGKGYPCNPLENKSKISRRQRKKHIWDPYKEKITKDTQCQVLNKY